MPPPAALTRAQMVGPEDAGGCSARNPKLLLLPAPDSAGLDGKMIRATGGFGGGVGAVEPPEEEEEEETPPPQQLLQRYLAAAGGQLEPGLCTTVKRHLKLNSLWPEEARGNLKGPG